MNKSRPPIVGPVLHADRRKGNVGALESRRKAFRKRRTLARNDIPAEEMDSLKRDMDRAEAAFRNRNFSKALRYYEHCNAKMDMLEKMGVALKLLEKASFMREETAFEEVFGEVDILIAAARGESPSEAAWAYGEAAARLEEILERSDEVKEALSRREKALSAKEKGRFLSGVNAPLRSRAEELLRLAERLREEGSFAEAAPKYEEAARALNVLDVLIPLMPKGVEHRPARAPALPAYLC